LLGSDGWELSFQFFAECSRQNVLWTRLGFL
jgi:hypothetical protein